MNSAGAVDHSLVVGSKFRFGRDQLSRAASVRLVQSCALAASSGYRSRTHATRLEWQTIRPVANWNDDPWRTHADVIAAFDGAIAALDTSAVSRCGP
jgi:hypothetical protein